MIHAFERPTPRRVPLFYLVVISFIPAVNETTDVKLILLAFDIVVISFVISCPPFSHWHWLYHFHCIVSCTY
jgi:hypothetical protein